MKKTILAMLMFAFAPANAALVTLNGPAFAKTEVYVDGQFGGAMGDGFDLPRGEHEISFAGPHAYEFQLLVNVGDTVAVKAAKPSRFDDCIKGRVSRFQITAWPSPVVQATPNGATILLAEPVIADQGEQGNCTSSPSMFTLRNLGKITLSAASVPVGAEVWIKGKKIATTDTSIVIPYTNGDRKPIQVVIRKSGYANCLRHIVLPESGDGAQSIECSLQAISQ